MRARPLALTLETGAGPRGAEAYGKMAHLSGETSNQLFEVLSDWNAQLSTCSLYNNPEELPFQLDSAAPQKTADLANSDGESLVERHGSGSWTG